MNLLARKAVLVHLKISTWNVYRREKEVSREVLVTKGAKQNQGSFTKRLFGAAALADIVYTMSQTRQYHYKHTLPWMSDGINILPNTLYLDYAKEMSNFKNTFNQQVDTFVKQYPQYIKEAQKDLGSLFNEDDYPNSSEAKAKFDFDLNILPIPDDFRTDMKKELLKELGNKLDARMADQLKEVMHTTAMRMAECIKHMSLRLREYKPKASGQQRPTGAFHDSLVENMRELCDLIPAFNINNNAKLDKIHRRIKEELCLHDAKDLKLDSKLRKRVKQSADEILKTVEEFLA